jgi:hypothetical protein
MFAVYFPNRVELYLYSPIRLHGVVLSLEKAQGQLYLSLAI